MSAILFGPSAAAAPAPTLERRDVAPRDAFLRVFNVRVLAIAFAVCALIAMQMTIGDLFAKPVSAWASLWLTSLRQNGISGVGVLLGIAVGHAGGAWLRERGVRHPAAEVALLAASVGVFAGLGAIARRESAILMYGPHEVHASFFVGAWILFCLFGALGVIVLRGYDERCRAERAYADETLQRTALEAQVTEAHLAALQAQIEPHFLFNTLANVRRLYEVDAPQGRLMLSSLVAYLRAALPSMRRSGTTVAREFELVRAYLTILQLRMGPRLAFSLDADPSVLALEIPPMVLPTLVENAIKHGLAPLPDGGRIDVRAERAGDRLRVEVADTGAGFRESGGTGVGLANTRARLATLYGCAAQLRLEAQSPHGIRAIVELPADARLEPSCLGAEEASR